MIIAIDGIGNFVNRNVIVISNKLVVSSIVCEGREGSDDGICEIC